MVGSIFFMASALASFILPSSGEVINIRVTIVGTLLGAVCFLIGAALMFPARRRFVHSPRPAVQHR
jgi:threonine/homoserine/homoserine lactone efflux protein